MNAKRATYDNHTSSDANKKARSEASTSIAGSLPSDILRMIFALVPTRPRIRVVSLVSKRWRAAALDTVSHLTYTHGPMPSILRLFPFLRSLKCEYVPDELVVLPETLTSLSIRATAVNIRIQEPYPALRHLTLYEHGLSANRTLLDVVQSSRSSLQTLDLVAPLTLSEEDCPYIPALREFSCEHAGFRAYTGVMLLVTLHMSQLRSLRLVGDAPYDMCAAVAVSGGLSNLTSLSLGYDAPADDIAMLLEWSPRLTDLSLCGDSFLAVPAPLLTALVDLSWQGLTVGPEILDNYSRLRNLTGYRWTDPRATLSPTMHTRLRTLLVECGAGGLEKQQTHAAFWSLLPLLSNLSSLSVCHAIPPPPDVGRPSRTLRSVRLGCKKKFTEGIAVSRYFLAQDSLRSLAMIVTLPLEVELEPLANLLRDAVLAGVEDVFLDVSLDAGVTGDFPSLFRAVGDWARLTLVLNNRDVFCSEEDLAGSAFVVSQIR